MKTSYHNGATTVLLQGGHNPDIKLNYYIEIVKRTTEEIPGLHLHAFSAPEIAAIAKYENKTSREVFRTCGTRACGPYRAEELKF